MQFLCSQCGACCRAAGRINAEKFGLPVKADGSCGHLVGNLCSIYDDRPDVCRTEKMIHKLPHQSEKDYYILATKACHTLIDLEGLDDSYKVDITQYDSM